VTAVVGLGDSVPAGNACGCTSFVSLVGTAWHVAVRNLARGVYTSADVLAQERRLHLTGGGGRTTIVTVGANDFDADLLSRPGYRAADGFSGYAATFRALQHNLAALLPQLPGTVLVTGYWNVFLDGEVGRARGSAYVRDSDALTRRVNDVLERAAVAAGATYVDLYGPFKGDGDRDDSALLAPDGDHPSAAGHALIAAVLDGAIGGSA
jgi:lysophospholipase L1-like esterase